MIATRAATEDGEPFIRSMLFTAGYLRARHPYGSFRFVAIDSDEEGTSTTVLDLGAAPV